MSLKWDISCVRSQRAAFTQPDPSHRDHQHEAISIRETVVNPDAVESGIKHYPMSGGKHVARSTAKMTFYCAVPTSEPGGQIHPMRLDLD